MKIFEEISSYKLFNYLLPGSCFSILVEKIVEVDSSLVQESIFMGFFLYYLIGLAISRVGSIIIEPVLKRLKFVRFYPYSSFVTALGNDPGIAVLSEVANTYRTLTALFGILLVVSIYEANVPFIILTLISTTLFLVSYRKQSNYLSKRIQLKS